MNLKFQDNQMTATCSNDTTIFHDIYDFIQHVYGPAPRNHHIPRYLCYAPFKVIMTDDRHPSLT